MKIIHRLPVKTPFFSSFVIGRTQMCSGTNRHSRNACNAHAGYYQSSQPVFWHMYTSVLVIILTGSMLHINPLVPGAENYSSHLSVLLIFF